MSCYKIVLNRVVLPVWWRHMAYKLGVTMIC